MTHPLDPLSNPPPFEEPEEITEFPWYCPDCEAVCYSNHAEARAHLMKGHPPQSADEAQAHYEIATGNA